MINTYENFSNKLNLKIRDGVDFYKEIITTIIKNPYRYAGLFRLSNAKTKLLQNITQSREIKFGDFMEDIVTDYLALRGFHNLPKWLGTNVDGDDLSADQMSEKDGVLYFVEQKIRDDHDSTKKRGQFENFEKKIKHIRTLYSQYTLKAYMWFIDDSLKKNKNYYLQKIDEVRPVYNDVEIGCVYGDDLFSQVLNEEAMWDEIKTYLSQWKSQHTNNIEIPNLDTDDTVFEAMKLLSASELQKLTSGEEIFVLIRRELFPNLTNLKRLKQYFADINDIRRNYIRI